MTYQELKKLFQDYESNRPATHLTAYITFSSFGSHTGNDYDWKDRTYIISSNNKAFQPNMGGYSIFGSCFNGTDQGIRLERYMKDEHGGKDGWIVEDCCVVGYLLISLSDGGISMPELFFTHRETYERMLFHLAQAAEVDFSQVKKEASYHAGVFESEAYEVNQNSAWLLDQDALDGMWQIQTVRIYSPLNMVFANE